MTAATIPRGVDPSRLSPGDLLALVRVGVGNTIKLVEALGYVGPPDSPAPFVNPDTQTPRPLTLVQIKEDPNLHLLHWTTYEALVRPSSSIVAPTGR